MTIAENVSGGKATLTLVLNNAVQGSFTVGLATVDGTATGGSDYTALSSATDNVTFAGNASENKTVEIAISDDSDLEGSEYFFFSIGSSTNDLVNVTDNATVTITDDEIALVTIADFSFSESENATVTLILDRAVPASFTVDVSTANGTATGGSDYTALDSTTTGRVTFNGTASENQTVTIPIISDSVVEGNESFTISMGNSSSNLVHVEDTATVTILDDDNATVSISTNGPVNEGDNVTVTLSVDKQVVGGFVVTLSSVDNGSATAGIDYTSISDNITFAGDASENQTVTIQITADEIAEDNQTFLVSGSSNNSSVTVGDALTVTIIDDDSAAVTIEDVNVNEGSNAGLTLTLNNEVEGGFTIDVTAESNGSASGSSGQNDFIGKTESITFSGSAGETKSFSVTTTNNGNANEGNETFVVVMRNLANTSASVTISDTATVTIIK